jgi:hypothetical protein
MEREHGDLSVLAVVAGDHALAAVVDLVVGGVPVLDDLQAGVDLAAQLRIGQVVAGYVESTAVKSCRSAGRTSMPIAIIPLRVQWC